MHEVLSLKGDTSVEDMWVLCHACLEGNVLLQTAVCIFSFTEFRVVVGA